MKLFLSILLLFSTAVVGAADYTDCANFFNPQLHERTSFPNRTGVMNGVYPFIMDKNGKVVAASWAKNYSKDDKTGNETIEYEIPVMKYDRGFIPGGMGMPKFDVDKKRIKVLINRDENGNITSIYDDTGINKKEIEEHNKIMKSWSTKIYNPQYIKEIEETNKKMGIKNEDFAYIPVGNRYKISMVGGKEGKCRIDGAEMDILTQAKIDGKRISATTFNTEACNDIVKALKTYKKQLESCTNPEANNAIRKIAYKFFQNNPDKSPYFGMGMMGGSYGAGYSMPMVGGGMGMIPGMGMGMIGGAFDTMMAQLQTNPLLAAAQANQYCAIYGLTPFLNNEYFPSEKSVIPSTRSKLKSKNK